MRISNIFSNQIPDRKKREMLNYLRALPVWRLHALGISTSLMEQGISAWPWRKDCSDYADVKEAA